MRGVDLGAALRREGRMLLHAIRVKAVNPENQVIDTMADAIAALLLGQLHDPAQAKRAQSGIVKGGGTGDVRYTNACMVDHDAAYC